jgi:hypothetical protein
MFRQVSVTLAVVYAAAVGAAAQERPWHGAGMDGLQVRDSVTTPCGQSGKYHYHQFKNVSNQTISFIEVVRYTDNGKAHEDTLSQTLTPGKTTSSGGSWVCADNGEATVTAIPEGQYRAANAAKKPSPSKPLFAGGNSQSAAAPGVVLDADCVKELKHEASLLDVGQSYQRFLAWAPFVSSFADGKPIEIAISLNNQDWTGVAEAVGGVGETTRLLMAQSAMLHATHHPYGSPTRKYWEQLERTYRESHPH